MEISNSCAGILVYSYFVYSFLSFSFYFHKFLLGFISSLPQLAWDKGFDVVVVVVVVVTS